jgi:hypothetical protein
MRNAADRQSRFENVRTETTVSYLPATSLLLKARTAATTPGFGGPSCTTLRPLAADAVRCGDEVDLVVKKP